MAEAEDEEEEEEEEDEEDIAAAFSPCFLPFLSAIDAEGGGRSDGRWRIRWVTK